MEWLGRIFIPNRNVVSEVVNNGLCIGCGVCAGVCPANNLVMVWNRRGEYNPVDQGRCVDGCSRCLAVCPFYPENPDEDVLANELFADKEKMARTSEAGWWLACFAGAVADDAERVQSASGGLASWTLAELLRRSMVDEVICVESEENPERLFHFGRFDNPYDLKRTRGSAYYPVEFSEMFRYIKTTNKKFAVTGLPCLVKALRLACRTDRSLEQKVPFIIGVTCGQMKSRKYAEYVASLAGVGEPLSNVFFRGKRNDAPASDFHFYCRGTSGKEGTISWTEGVSKIWGERWFSLESCGYCDDVFAETADAVFMDAWLPEYVNDSRGTSLVIIRSPDLLELLQGNGGGRLDVHPIDVGEVIRSQQGVVVNKRRVLSYRLSKRPKTIAGKPLEKRVAPDPSAIGLFARLRTDVLDSIGKATGTWDVNKETARELKSRIAPELKKLQLMDRAIRLMKLPRRTAGKLFRMIRASKG